MKGLRWMVLLLALGSAGASVAGERVVLCKGRVEPCRSATVLGEGEGYVWAKVDDGALSAADSTLLYFSVADYEAAVAGLGPKERAQAIGRRQEMVAANLPGFVFAQLAGDLRQVALRAASADLDVLVEAAAVLDGSDQRLAGATVGELLDMARTDLAEVTAELSGGPFAKAFADEAAEVGQLAVETRKDPAKVSPPFAETMAAYFVPALPDKQVRVLRDAGAYPHPWRGGVTAILGKHQTEQPPFKGQRLRELYPDRRDYVTDSTELTGPQWDTRLQARLQHGYDRQSFIARRIFEHAVLCRSLANQFRQRAAHLIDRWHGVEAMAIENLRRILAATPATPDAAQARADLRSDLALSAALLRTARAPERKMSQLARAAQSLARLSP
jgi:hypothetical protein